jgi:hypothetical protein
MAKKKKKKKTGAKSPPASRADRVDAAIEAVQLERRERALKRVLEWAWLERALDHALDHAVLGADALSLWRDSLAALPAEDSDDPVDRYFCDELLPNITNRHLMYVLQVGIARCHLVSESPAPFVALSTWFSPKEAEDKWASYEIHLGETALVERFSADLAAALRVARRLLEEDLALAKTFDSVPGEEDLDVLRRLRERPKTAKELAVEIADGKAHLADEKRVERAIERLRKTHGFELPNVRGAGYSLSSGDRARLDRIPGGT